MPSSDDVTALFASFAADQPFVEDFRAAKSGVLHVADMTRRLPRKHFWVSAPEAVDGAEAHFRDEGYDLVAMTTCSLRRNWSPSTASSRPSNRSGSTSTDRSRRGRRALRHGGGRLPACPAPLPRSRSRRARLGLAPPADRLLSHPLVLHLRPAEGVRRLPRPYYMT